MGLGLGRAARDRRSVGETPLTARGLLADRSAVRGAREVLLCADELRRTGGLGQKDGRITAVTQRQCRRAARRGLWAKPEGGC